MWFRCGAALVGAWVAVSCSPAKAPLDYHPCRPLGMPEPSVLQQEYAETQGAFLLSKQGVFECQCGTPREVKGASADRGVKGASAERDVKGATAERDVKGASADRDVKGASADRDVKGASADRDVKGASADRDLKSASADRDVKGASADEAPSVSCVSAPECGGFRVSGADVTHVYDGQQFVAASPSCIRSTR